MSFLMQSARVAMRVLQRTSPAWAAALAERLFFTPPRTRLAPQAEGFLRTGRPFRVCVDAGRIAAWSWGQGPVVVLVHGWGGRGGRLAAAYATPLVNSGFSVVAFDAPGHGASDGRLSSMPQFARALRAVSDAAGSVFAVVAHSMGSSATALAISHGLDVERAVFLAPAASPARFAADFADVLGVGPEAMWAMRHRSEQRLGFRWAELDVPRMARRFDVPLLVIHDQDDPTVPWADGAAIAAVWPGAELVTTTGLGHREIVRAPEVVDRVLAFVRTGHDRVARDGSRNAVTDEAAWLERDLFQRDDRQRRILAHQRYH